MVFFFRRLLLRCICQRLRRPVLNVYRDMTDGKGEDTANLNGIG